MELLAGGRASRFPTVPILKGLGVSARLPWTIFGRQPIAAWLKSVRLISVTCLVLFGT